MLAQRVVVPKPNQVKLETFDLPEVGAHHALIQARATLISPGTERAFYTAAPNTNASYPMYPGYSYIGEVLEVGAEVKNLQVGDRIACTENHRSHEVVLAENCLKVPDSVSDEDASFFNLIAIAMQGVRKAQVELGEPVLVMGAGLIGLFAAQLAQLSGGLPVISADINQERLNLAKEIGIDHAFISDDSLGEKLGSVSHERGPAVTIEATGVPPVVVSAFQLTADLGRVVLLGSTRGETDGVNFYRDVHRKGLTVIGGHEITRPSHENHAGWWTQKSEHQVALDLLAAGRIQTQPFISHCFDSADFPKAYDLLTDGKTASLGMVINWS